MSGRFDDPESQAARVFVGGVNPDTEEQVLIERFSKHGNVKGVNILKGFAFVQFCLAEEAQQAILNENGTEFRGKTIDVKSAKRGNTREQNNISGPINNGNWGFNSQRDNGQGNLDMGDFRDRSNDRNGGQNYNHDKDSNSDWMNNERDGFRGGNFRGNGRDPEDRHSRGRGRGGDRGRGSFGFRGSGYGRGNRGGGNYGGRGGSFVNQIDGPQSGYTGPGGYNPPSGPNLEQDVVHPIPSNEMNRVNDAEIVCVSRFQRGFAEVIEARMKSFGMQTDVLFPNPDIPLQKILSNITSRGVLFAIIVTPLHEEHRSMTVNILQGPQPQEHRNMPFDDAISLVAKTFEKHTLNKNNPDIGDGASSIGSNNRDNFNVKHGNDQINSGSGQLPNDVRNVLGFLLDQRPLSVMEYDKLIKWLAQQRLQVLQAEYGDNVPSELATPPVGPQLDPETKAQQHDLQERILNILNKPKYQSQENASSGMQPVPGGSGVDNPLQRAIDNLIRTGPNLLNQVAHPGNSGNIGPGGDRGAGSSSGSGIGQNTGGETSSYSGFGLMGNY